MVQQALAWVLFVIGVGSMLALGLLIGCGAVVERIWWADRALATSLASWFSTGIMLMFLGSASGSRSIVYMGFALVLGGGAYVLVLFLPLVLIVARVRKRKGWLLSIAGKQPDAR